MKIMYRCDLCEEESDDVVENMCDLCGTTMNLCQFGYDWLEGGVPCRNMMYQKVNEQSWEWKDEIDDFLIFCNDCADIYFEERANVENSIRYWMYNYKKINITLSKDVALLVAKRILDLHYDEFS